MTVLDTTLDELRNRKYHLFYSHTLYQRRSTLLDSEHKIHHVQYKRITDENMNDNSDIVTITEAVQATPENSGDNLASFIETKKIVSDTIYLGIGTWYSSTPL